MINLGQRSSGRISQQDLNCDITSIIDCDVIKVSTS